MQTGAFLTDPSFHSTRPARPARLGPAPTRVIRSTASIPPARTKNREGRERMSMNSVKHPYVDRPLRTETVKAQELQTAVLLVLALYASVAILNLRSELAAAAQHWQLFIEFLANAIL